MVGKDETITPGNFNKLASFTCVSAVDPRKKSDGFSVLTGWTQLTVIFQLVSIYCTVVYSVRTGLPAGGEQLSQARVDSRLLLLV